MMNHSELVSRRQFVARAGAAALVASAGPAAVAAVNQYEKPLRVIAYNIYVNTGWPKDRSLAKKAGSAGQLPSRLANELALFEPDILNFSESPSEAVVKEIAVRLGMNHVRFPSGGNWPGTLLTRYEIANSRNVPLQSGGRPEDLFTRHWGRAMIKLPQEDSLIIHSAHLHPAEDPSIRLREIRAMLSSMKVDLESGRSMLLIGDLNHVPNSEEYKMWIDAGWSDTFAEVGRGEGFTIPADAPKKRIDYVMAAGPIARRIAESRPLFEGAFRVNTADPQSFSLSDHLPQLAVFGKKP